MKFDDIDRKMRVFETADDHCVLPGMFIVARLDGRNFTRLTKEICHFEAPYDSKFRDAMTDTTVHLMGCGFKVLYGYSQSDEISLMFHRDEDAFGRKTRKLISILSGEASAKFSMLVGTHGVFDCRLSQLPSKDILVDYFRWRQEDAHRNTLNAHCYWMLRKDSLDEKQATAKLLGMSVSEKNELLFKKGINFNDLPSWQKRGIGVYRENFEKPSKDPRTGEETTASRKRLVKDLELPMGDEYAEFIQGFLSSI